MNRSRAATAVSALALIAASLAFAGPLNPPAGPVASSGKTTQEIYDKAAAAEPRVAINATNTPGDADATFVISQPGSYYLTGNLTAASGRHGIQVIASNVTIDLNGFVLRGSGAGVTRGITDTLDEQNPQRALKVTNGQIVGFNQGFATEWMGGVRLEDLRVESTGDGILVNGGGEVRRCELIGPGSATSAVGISIDGPASISDSRAFGFNIGIFAAGGAIRDSHAESCAVGLRVGQLAESCTTEQCTTGIELGARSIVRGCAANASDVGFRLTGLQCTLSGNTVTSSSQAGIRVEALNARLENNTITGNTGSPASTGIQVLANFNGAYIDGNVVRAVGTGIQVNAINCVIVRNAASPLTAGAAAYQIVSGNRFGPLVKAVNGGATTVTANSANTAGSFTTTDPNSNLFW